MGTPAYPSGNPGNTFVPSFEASGQLVVSYSRNPKDFKLNQYITLTPVKNSVGYFLQVTPENAARVLSSDGADMIWPDGNDAPSGDWNDESFQFTSFLTNRFAPTVSLGYKAVEQASWKIKAYHAAMLAQQAMTLRTLKTYTVLSTSGNYPTANTATFKTWATAGGSTSTQFANAGTPSNPVIQFALTAMAQVIQQATLGVVRPKDLCVVINPVTALGMAASQEIHLYLQQSPYALAQVRGDVENQNGEWGLPTKLYGFEIVVDDTVRVSTNKVIPTTTYQAGSYIFDSNTLYMVARPGQLVGVEGAPSFSSVHLFSYEEMTVESKDDVDNRRHKIRVVDDYAVQPVSPVSMARATNLFS